MELYDLVYLTKRLPDTNYTSATQARHKCNKIEAREDECNTNGTITTRLKSFHFDNDTSKAYFRSLILAI